MLGSVEEKSSNITFRVFDYIWLVEKDFIHALFYQILRIEHTFILFALKKFIWLCSEVEHLNLCVYLYNLVNSSFETIETTPVMKKISADRNIILQHNKVKTNYMVMSIYHVVE